MDRINEPRFTVAELSEATSVSRRNIRFYTQQGLVPNAVGKGRSRYYTSIHVERVTMVRDMRARGISIEEIAEALAPEPTNDTDTIDGEAWNRIHLRDDLEIHIRQDAPEAVTELVRQFKDLYRVWLGPDDDAI